MGGRALSASDAPASASGAGLFQTLAGKAGAVGLRALRGRTLDASIRRGAALGRAYFRAGGPRVSDGRVNLRIAFPEWSEARRAAVLRAALENLGRSLAEFACLGDESDDALRARVRVEGLEHLTAAWAPDREPPTGVIVLTAHLGNWELIARAMAAHGYPLTVVHRGRDNPLMERLVTGARTTEGSELLTRGNAARGALRALRTGRFLAMPYDQNCSRKEGVFAPFFGRLAASRVTPIRLAAKTRAPILPVFIEREADGIDHVCHVRPVLELATDDADPGGAIVENARRMNRVLEDEIRRIPEQWIWTHRRWKTQPPGEPRPPYA